MKIICLNAVLLLGIAVPVKAQEFRKPDETKEIVIKSTYPARIAFVWTPDDKLYVWVGFRPVYKTNKEEGYHYTGFLTDKLNIYENGRLVREIVDLNDMPEPRLIKSAYIGHDLDVFPRSEEDRANTIVISSTAGSVLLGLGFTKNETVLGPFPYQVNVVRTSIQADKGLVYVEANCGNTYDKKIEKNGEINPFSVLFTLDRGLNVVDNFIFDEGTEGDKYEIHPSGGRAHLTGTGLYLVSPTDPAETIRIKIKKWKLKDS